MRYRLLRPVWAVTALAVAGAALLAILSVLRGDFGETDGRTVVALASVFLCGGAAIAGLHLIDRGLPLLSGLVLIAASVELALFQLGIWKAEFGDGTSNEYIKLVPIMAAWAIATLVLGTLPLLITAHKRLLVTIVPTVGACALVGATIATVLVWRESDNQAWGKTLAVLAILVVAGYLLTPLAERLTRPQGSTP
jgi:hypothetical protein